MKATVLLLLACCASACGRRGPASPVAPGLAASGSVQTVSLPGARPSRWLVVGGSEQEGAAWFLREGRGIRRLPPPPVALFPRSLSPSPDGRYLAVVSVGEGHPILDILDLGRLLAGTHGEEPLRTIDPYPGSIELTGWTGARLKVQSDRPLTACCDPVGRAAGSEVFEQSATFLIDPGTGAITQE